ncbi:YhgE/Pip domain-containing protein [Levilactobacillus brevis]|uniref:YhgE/Pip domain protein n=2 Tax=Levilactobacillus brevis TaxID=1580 RepID=U2PPW8_LEVBR|nr:ABC transporter permease [Levilactobacillus brevis]ERK45804.1 hypothetical protein HMPREF0495_00197 [Levilactobacillus brevis ATCC 14869 = DSM 20054]KID44807.1 hypothetical protein LbDm2_0164 [Levilactobacillus brevis]KIO97653.1 membrane protein [Levilactobacillus brevis]KRK21734.1 putative membrane protein [Levilactobacillus brevis ATCC 14869 = DSM 20054]MCU0199746.1 hypothetical protein [Levilactobacillus brevis]
MLNVFKRKNIWISMLVVAILIGLFAFAQVGARSTVKVRHLPLALVVNDNGKDAKNVVNKLRKESHEKNSEIKWVNVNHTNELTKGFASGKYYGAVVIHSGFTKAINQQADYLKGKIITQKLDTLVVKTPLAAETALFQQQKALANSLTQKTPAQAKVSLYVSQGSNVTVANILTTALPKLTDRLNQKISNEYITVANKSRLTLSPQDWSKLQTPIHTTLIKRNQVSTKEVSGMAPFLVTIFCWLGSLIASLLNWRDHSKNEKKRRDGRLSLTGVTSQLISGVAIVTAIAVSVYFFTKVCYDVPIHDPQQFLLLIGGISFVFYLLQSAVLDLLGLKGWPLLLIIWIGSMAVITFIPQMLSPFYHNYVYDLTPIRFAYDLILNQMYITDASLTGSSMLNLLYIGIASIAVMYGSTLIKRHKESQIA